MLGSGLSVRGNSLADRGVVADRAGILLERVEYEGGYSGQDQSCNQDHQDRSATFALACFSSGKLGHCFLLFLISIRHVAPTRRGAFRFPRERSTRWHAAGFTRGDLGDDGIAEHRVIGTANGDLQAVVLIDGPFEDDVLFDPVFRNGDAIAQGDGVRFGLVKGKREDFLARLARRVEFYWRGDVLTGFERVIASKHQNGEDEVFHRGLLWRDNG